MTDIVTDLRTLAAMPEYDRAADMFEKCAAEIERLRAALEPLACTCDRPNGEACSRSEVDCPFWQARAALATQPAEEDRA